MKFPFSFIINVVLIGLFHRRPHSRKGTGVNNQMNDGVACRLTVTEPSLVLLATLVLYFLLLVKMTAVKKVY